MKRALRSCKYRSKCPCLLRDSCQDIKDAGSNLCFKVCFCTQTCEWAEHAASDLLVPSGRALNNQYLDLDMFLGTHISENLTWKITALVKKAQQRLPSNTEEEPPGGQTASIPSMGCHRLRANVVCSIFWFAACSAADKWALLRITSSATAVHCTPLLETSAAAKASAGERRSEQTAHTLVWRLFSRLPSAKRFRSLRCRTDRFYSWDSLITDQ